MSLFPLSRREALRTAGTGGIALLAGCSSRSARGDVSIETSSLTAMEAPDSSPTLTLSPVTADEFEFDASVLQQFTADHPARIRFRFTNTSDRTFFMSPKNLGPFTQDYSVEGESSGAMMVLVNDRVSLVDPDTHDATKRPSEPRTGCWRLDADLLIPRTLIIGDVGSGETIAEEYTCYAHRENANCLPPGSYPFTENHDLRPGSFDDEALSRPLTRIEFRNTLIINDASTLSIEVRRSEGG